MIFAFSLLLPLGVFLFYRNYLDDSLNKKIIYIVPSVLLILGVVSYAIIGDAFLLSMGNPLLSLLVYVFLIGRFRRKFERNPIDTAYNFSSGMMLDRLFNIIFVILGIIGPMLLSIFIIDSILH